MTRREYVSANVSPMGSNPRLRRLVPPPRAGWVLERLAALRDNRVRSTRSLTTEERLALASQRERFAALLARLPAPRLP